MTFREDECRARKDHSARNLAMIRRAVLNMLRREPSKKSLKRKRAHEAAAPLSTPPSAPSGSHIVDAGDTGDR